MKKIQPHAREGHARLPQSPNGTVHDKSFVSDGTGRVLDSITCNFTLACVQMYDTNKHAIIFFDRSHTAGCSSLSRQYCACRARDTIAGELFLGKEQEPPRKLTQSFRYCRPPKHLQPSRVHSVSVKNAETLCLMGVDECSFVLDVEWGGGDGCRES